MNILIETFHSPYTGERVGGAETSLRLIGEEFSKRGHKVTFFSKSHIKTWAGFKIKEIKGVKVVIFTKFKIRILNTYKAKKISRFFQDLFIKKELKNIQIVHTYNNIGIVKYYAKLKPKFNFKLIVRMAGLKLFEDFESKPQHIHIYEKYFKAIDLYNFISEGLRELVLQKKGQFSLNINFNPSFIKDIGIDIYKLPSKDLRHKKESSTFKIVMASRLSKYQKRQDLLIEAMVYLKRYDVQLTVLGNGPNKRELERLVEQNNLSKKIIFKPFEKNIWNALIDYDLLVHSCDYEGLSKIIIESMGVGLPVLASNVTPLNTYIIDNKNGFLVDNDPIDWAEKIKIIIKKQSLLKDISENSKKFIASKYDSSINSLVYEEIFENLLNKKND
jgi:glycosyltransferase involved in cell wall biosynthesis